MGTQGPLREYFDSPLKEGKPNKWVYLLDHQYTQEGLGWNRLKNGDRLRAKVLAKVAESLNLDIYMALADIQETWDAESEDDDRYSRRHRYSGWSDEEDEDAEADDEHSGENAHYNLLELIYSRALVPPRSHRPFAPKANRRPR